jgi:hypothetical protein
MFLVVVVLQLALSNGVVISSEFFTASSTQILVL